ncbi:MAG TPA: PIN domain nuclease [Nitrospiraceae bacterium]|nr:PIN domain nuclease [Nitrospiraceae bacterium]
MGLIIIRSLFVFIGIILGYYSSTQIDGQINKIEGMAIGFGVAVLIILTELLFRKVSLKVILGGILGFIVGLVSANIIASPLRLVPLEKGIVNFIILLLNAFFGYLGITIGIREGDRFNPTNIKKLFKGAAEENIKILDTSVIIDGRVADVCETEFLDGTIIIPQFILQELQHIADSSDSLKRARGRRGLDVLHRIQKMNHMEVRITEEDFPKIREVDSKLVALGKKLGAKVVTNDFNLNKVAELQGVKVLNINDLSNAVKPVALPGESMRVFVLKEGKESGQGVAYLDDGTMIVVENGRKHISKNVEVTVTSVLQTAAGRMIFTKLREDMEYEFQAAGKN